MAYVEYEADGKTIKARVWQKVDTLANWEANSLVIGPGEQAFVIDGVGTPINFKIGDGTKRFSELPFWIQYDQAAFIPVSGLSLPTPTQPVGYSILGEGTYTHASGDVVVPAGHWGVANWDGSAWSFSDMGALPAITGVDVIDPNGNGVPTEKAVADYALEKNSLRIFPEGYEIYEIDRPDLVDLPDIVFVSSDGVIISQNYGIDFSLLRDYSFEHFDRPDLSGFIEVDSEYYILSAGESSGGGSGGIVDYDVNLLPLFSKKFYEQAPVSSFVSANFYDYNALISSWDSIMSKANTASNYCIKKELGRSSTKNLPIYSYEFIPEKPKHKILVNTGLHASEKVYIHLLNVFFDRFVDDWYKDPLLQWLRLNVHFVVVPCLSPSCMEGLTSGSSGGRRVHETTPIDITWTKTGNVVTLTYNVANFPNTNGRLDGATYFSNPNIVNKNWVSIFDSSSQLDLPDNGYVVKSIVNGNTITIQTPSSGDASGTAKLYVGVDINRNFQPTGSNIWDLFSATSSSSTQYSNDYVPNPNDNKGTKPFSLSESIILRDLIKNNPDIMFYVDLHSGAGNNYLHWNTKEYDGQNVAIDEVKEHQSIFNNDGYSRVVKDADSIPYSTKYSVEEINKPGYTIEWQQLSSTTQKEATDAMRWLTTFFISFIRNLK